MLRSQDICLLKVEDILNRKLKRERYYGENNAVLFSSTLYIYRPHMRKYDQHSEPFIKIHGLSIELVRNILSERSMKEEILRAVSESSRNEKYGVTETVSSDARYRRRPVNSSQWFSASALKWSHANHELSLEKVRCREKSTDGILQRTLWSKWWEELAVRIWYVNQVSWEWCVLNLYSFASRTRMIKLNHKKEISLLMESNKMNDITNIRLAEEVHCVKINILRTGTYRLTVEHLQDVSKDRQ